MFEDRKRKASQKAMHENQNSAVEDVEKQPRTHVF
jgi:hypothetical protein